MPVRAQSTEPAPKRLATNSSFAKVREHQGRGACASPKSGPDTIRLTAGWRLAMLRAMRRIVQTTATIPFAASGRRDLAHVHRESLRPAHLHLAGVGRTPRG